MPFPTYNLGKDVNNKQVPNKPKVESIFLLNGHLGPLPLSHHCSYGFNGYIFCFFFPFTFLNSYQGLWFSHEIHYPLTLMSYTDCQSFSSIHTHLTHGKASTSYAVQIPLVSIAPPKDCF